MKFKIKSFLVIWILLVLATGSIVVKADYVDPTAKTNVNAQTDFFEKSNDDWSAMQDQISGDQASLIDGAKSEKGLDYLAKKSKEEITEASGSLSSIQANDLSSRGRELMIEENMIDDLYVDFSKELNKQCMTDARGIANAQDALMKNLLPKLKKFGVDCKTAKGSEHLEPEYYLQVKNEQIKDTVYKKTLCAEPRNSYNCNNSLIVRCSKRGIRWGAWQNRTMVRTFDALPNHWFHFVRTVTKSDRFTINNAYHYEIEAYIANIIGAKTEQISASNQNVVLHQSPHLSNLNRNVDLSNCNIWEALTAYGYYRWYNKALITLHYKYRESYAVCDKWSEDWSETCILK